MGIDLTQGPIGKILFRLTLPMVLGIFSIIGFNLADTYFVGQLGSDELAAISFTFPVVLFFGSISMGLSAGASSVIARAIGERDPQKVRRYTTDSLVLSLVIVAFSIIIGFLTIDPLFRLLGAEGKVLGLVKDYMSIWYGGMIFLVVPMVGNGAIRAKGITSIPATIMTVAALANFILDPLLIFGLGPFPALGLKGAALATVFARGVTLLASLYFLIFRLKMIDFKPPTFQVGLRSWKEILRVGVPTAATNVVVPITISIITAMISEYGYESVAAFGIVSKVQSFAMIVLWGVSSSMGPFAGQNYGAGKVDRVLKASFISYGFSLIWGLLIFILLYVFSENIILLFNKNPNVVKVGVLYLTIVPITYGFEGLRLIASSTFNGIGKPFPPTIMVLIKVVVIYIPFAYFGSRYYGVKGIFIAESLGNFLIGVLSFILIKKVCSKEKVMSAS